MDFKFTDCEKTLIRDYVLAEKHNPCRCCNVSKAYCINCVEHQLYERKYRPVMDILMEAYKHSYVMTYIRGYCDTIIEYEECLKHNQPYAEIQHRLKRFSKLITTNEIINMARQYECKRKD